MVKQKKYFGFTLIEVLVVVSSFAVLAILVTLTIAASLKGSRKSESASKVRTEMEYALGIIERQIRNASTIPVCAASPSRITFEDEEGIVAGFSNLDGGDYSYIASGSAYIPLTSSAIDVTASFSCNASGEEEGVPTSVTISLTGVSTGSTGTEANQVTIDTQVMLRNY